MMVTGLLRSRDGRLTKIAQKVLYDYKTPSLVSRFERFIKSQWLQVKPVYEPLARQLLQRIATTNRPLVLMMDSTKLGGRCLCFLISVY